MVQHNELGKQGEQIAVDYLIKNGYEILERNWYYRKAEVDIIAQKGDYVCCVEVKTRNSAFFGNPQDFVNEKKIKLQVLAMDYYMNEKDLDYEVRFDIIAIILNKKNTEIEHLEDAFLYFE
ncbi:YraN family protein [Aureivirga sp. CE67]|uniref:YraN family protein n=1 Tax=Aureivirga sp. CE67 TaxID=1788983 RepID=UPI0018C8EA15|nr:YraN family protein [Aureivirga sp. CE67]